MATYGMYMTSKKEDVISFPLRMEDNIRKVYN